MNTPTKASGTAAMVATAVVVTLTWLLDLYGIKIPDVVSQAWQGGLMVLAAYFIHSDPPT